MHKVNYYKYAANGNNFVLIDEINEVQIREQHKALFSKYVSNKATGIGCDSLIVLQKYTNEVLNQICPNKNHYKINSNTSPEYIMRIYENGLESNMCGNGLICLAHHLLRSYSIRNIIIATEIPTQRIVSRLLSVMDDKNNIFDINLGKVYLPSSLFFNPDLICTKTKNGLAYRLKNITLKVAMMGKEHELIFEHCYITFTGEPHVVIFRPSYFTGSCQNLIHHQIFDILFDPAMSPYCLSTSSFIVNQIGKQFNELTQLFPQGVNINFAEICPDGKIANRCYERIINAETYSCGTGATAVAVLANELSLLNYNKINILPWRARFEYLYKDAEMLITRNDNTYNLSTQSVFLAQGEYYYSDHMRNESKFNENLACVSNWASI